MLVLLTWEHTGEALNSEWRTGRLPGGGESVAKGHRGLSPVIKSWEVPLGRKTDTAKVWRLEKARTHLGHRGSVTQYKVRPVRGGMGEAGRGHNTGTSGAKDMQH